MNRVRFAIGLFALAMTLTLLADIAHVVAVLNGEY